MPGFDLNRRAARGISWAYASVVLCAGLSAAAERQQEARDFFDSTNLLTFRVEIDRAGFDALAQRPRTYVPGKVRVGERVWENVGIRLKGSGTFEPVFRHPSLTLKFNWREPHQRFSGLPKLFLENSGQDATLMCKLIANGAFTDGGIPAPRITQARVQLNGRDLGYCVVSEAIDKDFLKDHFGNATGTMYEAFFADINGRLKQDNGQPCGLADLRELSTAATQKDDDRRRQSLERLLDVDEFLNFLAIERILANWDGYAFHQNNYRVYHNPSSGRMSFIPHDLDNTLFESGMGLMPPRNGILTAALLKTPEDRQAFRERIARLFPLVLDPQRIEKRMDASVARLSQGATPEQVAALGRQAALLRQRVRERWQHFRDELDGKRPLTPEFDSAGVARLNGWTAKPDWNSATIKTVSEEGKPELYIEAAGGYCFGSWRLPVWLPPGRYRLEGQAKTRGVAGLPSQTGSGAGLRVLGGRRGRGLWEFSPWTTVQHTFVVQQDCEWVELIAELRAFSGSAWFDPESLRLVRVNRAAEAPGRFQVDQ